LSGIHSAIVTACAGDNISSSELSDALNIDWRTASAGKKKRVMVDQEKSKILTPPVLTKEKISYQTEMSVKKFIDKNVVPSSSAKNVRQKKVNGIVEKEVMHWRTESIEELYNKYITENEHNWISFSAFYSRIPWYVYSKPQRTGLCIYHTRARTFIEVLRKLRSQWHGKDCKCNCNFCKTDGCAHGTKSVECEEGTCNKCKNICCPLEKQKTNCSYTIIEYFYEKNANGNKQLKQSTTTYVKPRKDFMNLWKSEMDTFRPHAEHHKYHKKRMEELFKFFENNKSTVIARWDFAENYVHESGAMVSTQHFAKQQSQLLIVSYWHHTEDNKVKLKYIAFTSDYLAHSTIFFKKCLRIFLEKLNIALPHKMDLLYLLTDGATQHFKNRRSFNNTSVVSFNFSNLFFFHFFSQHIRTLDSMDF
jgi:hypothetical protein